MQSFLFWGETELASLTLALFVALSKVQSAEEIAAIGRDIAQGLVRPYAEAPVLVNERTSYGQVLRSLLALTVDHLGFRWWKAVMFLDWSQCDRMQLHALQKDASVIFVLLVHVMMCAGDSRCLCMP